jgi:hypothetical protein
MDPHGADENDDNNWDVVCVFSVAVAWVLLLEVLM